MFAPTITTFTLCTAFLAGLPHSPVHAQSFDNALNSFKDNRQYQFRPATRVAQADARVVLYRTAWCGYCKRAAAYMQTKGIPFVERDIERNALYREEYKKLGGEPGVPFMVFGQKTMKGFTTRAFDKHYADFQVAQGSPNR